MSTAGKGSGRPLRVTAVRIIAAVFGVTAGLLGLEHGAFEALQGGTAWGRAPDQCHRPTVSAHATA
jgi:hypothetical protein